ncbi:MAG: DUF5597 domain-containing protein [Oscillospiraceae bacterium]|nr:DUF5597 domain-containing protein [Oscillospiraceae bacterium]
MIPHIEKKNGHPVLMVKDRPMILIAGEVHNSDSSSPAYMEGIWNIAKELGMNTLLLPAPWDLIEPEEGSFDFSIPRALIDQARAREMHIVFLWFGSWKNAECMYAPAWVKQDLKRFPRAQIEKGRNKAGRQVSPTIPVKMPYTTLSYLGQETMRSDAKAFAAFMSFLKDYDEAEQTVVAVQVENETGLLGAAREVSDEADALFAAPVPADFAAYMRNHTDTMTEEIRAAVLTGKPEGSWQEVFGDAAEELFSAYHVAGFVNTVAEAGKQVYPLPMAANCWLDKGGKPGSYPTGGPVSKVHEVWDFCAPNIEVYCPDIYVPQFKAVCDEFTRRGGALFIPESATHSYCAPRLVYTLGHYHAMCYSPFGFDDIGKPFTAVQGFLFGMDVSDPALKTPQSFEEYAAFGQILREMTPMLAQAYGTDRLQAVSAETDPVIPGPGGNPFAAVPPTMDFGSFRLSVRFQSPMNPRNDGACLCLKISDSECWVVGSACGLTFTSADPAKPNLDLMQVEEGRFENGAWIPGRRLNGDETASLSLEKPAVLHVRFFTYE